MVLRGKYEGDLQYHELEMVETLPPPISADRAMVLAVTPSVWGGGSATQTDPRLVDAPVGGISSSNTPPWTSEDEPAEEVLIGGSHTVGLSV